MSKGEAVLLDCWANPFCLRAKIALAEKGVEYEARAENLFGGKSDLLLKSNPINKKVPVFLHDGKPLLGLRHHFSHPVLMRELRQGSGQILLTRRSDYDSQVFDAVCNIWKTKGNVPGTAKNEFIEILKQLEGALGEKDFFGGDSFGFVDVIAIPLTCWFYAVEKFGEFKVENECPKFSAWMNKCMQRETVARIFPDPEKVTNLLSR
ncbi:glutathione S-transferase U19 [Citrus sinensis]|uniref:Glutathione S-transferase U19 n=1 Tax=Citrus sinensis TaxID=2711 RepID=A0ACB8LDJ5_CITSI|nr:glutathione S-transferase U19 [Citrus sinensis]